MTLLWLQRRIITYMYLCVIFYHLLPQFKLFRRYSPPVFLKVCLLVSTSTLDSIFHMVCLFVLLFYALFLEGFKFILFLSLFSNLYRFSCWDLCSLPFPSSAKIFTTSMSFWNILICNLLFPLLDIILGGSQYIIFHHDLVICNFYGISRHSHIYILSIFNNLSRLPLHSHVDFFREFS